MKSNTKLEGLMILMMLMPVLYLAMEWKTMPDTVPMHFNYKGEADRYGSKMELLALVVLMNPVVYLLMKLVPKIDPKRKIDADSKQYISLRIIMSLILSGLSAYIIYLTMHSTVTSGNFMLIIFGTVFILLGNYIQTVKPNYFIGIKTPWALENADNWRYTHRLGGKAMVICGAVTILAALFFSPQTAGIIFVAGIIIEVAVPFVFSYLFYVRNKNEAA